MADTAEITDVRDLAQFRALWRSLVKQTPRGGFGQSLEFLEAAWPAVAADSTLRVVLVFEDAETVWLIPLADRKRTDFRPRLRQLTHAIPGFAAFSRGVGARSTAVAKSLFNHVLKHRRDWDVLDLFGQDTQSDGTFMLKAGAESAGLCQKWIPTSQSVLIDLSGPFAGYWQRRPVSLRRELERLESEFEADHRIEHLRWRSAALSDEPDDCRWDLFQECVEIGIAQAGASQDGRSTGTAGDGGPASRVGLLRSVHPAACRHGAVDVNLLMVDGEPAAFLYNYVWLGNVQTVWRGWVPHPDGEPAARVLALRMIRDSFDRADRTIDLGPGSLAFVRGLQTQVLTQLRLLHFSTRSIRGRLESLKHRLVRSASGP